MTVPTTFADLSATPASNSGLISAGTVVNEYDDHCRTLYAFVASISTNSGNGWVSPYLPTAGGTVSGNLTVSGTLTGSTGVMNIGAGQFYKSAAGNIGIGTASPNSNGPTYSNLELRGTSGGGGFFYSGDSAAKFKCGYGAAAGGGIIGTINSDSLYLIANNATVLELKSTNAIAIANCSAAPSAPASGGVLYVESGALKYIGSGGTVTTIGVP